MNWKMQALYNELYEHGFAVVPLAGNAVKLRCGNRNYTVTHTVEVLSSTSYYDHYTINDCTNGSTITFDNRSQVLKQLLNIRTICRFGKEEKR